MSFKIYRQAPEGALFNLQAPRISSAKDANTSKSKNMTRVD